MAIRYGYYTEAPNNFYESVHFLSISPKTHLVEGKTLQQTDRDGTPKWVVSAVVKYGKQPTDTENFTLTAPIEVGDAIKQIRELTPVKLVGLEKGKWAREVGRETYWTFSIKGVEVLK